MNNEIQKIETFLTDRNLTTTPLTSLSRGLVNSSAFAYHYEHIVSKLYPASIKYKVANALFLSNSLYFIDFLRDAPSISEKITNSILTLKSKITPQQPIRYESFNKIFVIVKDAIPAVLQMSYMLTHLTKQQKYIGKGSYNNIKWCSAEELKNLY